MKKYRLVIFDLDGTLYPITKKFKFFLALRNFSYISLFRAHLSHIETLRKIDFQNREALLDTHFSALSAQTNKSIMQIKEWYFNHFYPTFVETIRKNAAPRFEINTLLTHLRKKDVKVALFSDYSFIKERLEALQIETNLFDILLSGEEEGALKPVPRPIEIIRQTFDISPDKTVIVGDRTDSDGEVAKQSGIDSLILEEKKNSNDKMLWSEFSTLILQGETV